MESFEATVRPEKPVFDAAGGTCLLSISRPEIPEPLRADAVRDGLKEKAEFHFTIIGNDTGAQIVEVLRKMDDTQRAVLLSRIEELVANTDWTFTLLPEFYAISKQYSFFDTRSAYIQLADMPALEGFYAELNQLLGTRFALPPPHLTLFTTSSDDTKASRGIGIYSREDFEALSPRKLGAVVKG